MNIIITSVKAQRKALKYYGLLLPLIFFTACGEVPTQDNALPKKSIAVTTSPAISIAPCEVLPAIKFLSPTLFEAGGYKYALLGLEPLTSPTSGVPRDYLDTLSTQARCIKHDPAIEDLSSVYLFDEKDSLLNASLIQNGYARATEKGSFIYKSLFEKLQKEAEEKGRGLWATTGDKNPVPQKQLAVPKGDISLTEVKNYIDVPVSFSFKVESVGRSDTGMYLNTLHDYQLPENIAIFLPLSGSDDRMNLLLKRGEGLLKHTIKVNGTVRLSHGKLVLTLEKGKDLLILD